MRITETTGRLLLMLLLALVINVTVQGQDVAPEDTVTVDTDLVLLRATVRDRQGRAVLGLKKEGFRVYEDSVEQAVSFFSAEESPVSWGLVLDRSGSMMEMMREVYSAALHVIDEGTSRDEMFIITFNDSAEMAIDFTSDKHRLENSTLGLRAEGSTALYDAVSYALDQFKRSKFRKRVLVVITDGEDNASRLPFRKLVERAEEEEVIIYTVGMFESSGMMGLGSSGGADSRPELEKLAGVTGGEAHFPTDLDGCRKVMKEIALEVSQQYSLGYYSINKNYDGKWRSVTIKVQSEAGRDKYAARTRSGYYARRRGASN